VNQLLEKQEDDAERSVHRGEEPGARPCASGATAGDQGPASDLEHRCGERELGARLARPSAGPSKREEERGNDGRFDQWPFAAGDQWREADLRDGTVVAAVCPGLIDTGASRPWFDDMSSAQSPNAAAVHVLRFALDPVNPHFHGELVQFGKVLPWR
jgi:hypothetical protein